MLGMEDRIPLGNFKGGKSERTRKTKRFEKKRSHYRTYRQVQIHFRI